MTTTYVPPWYNGYTIIVIRINVKRYKRKRGTVKLFEKFKSYCERRYALTPLCDRIPWQRVKIGSEEVEAKIKCKKKKKMKNVVSLISPQKLRQGRWPLRFGFRRLSSTATRFYATSLLPSSDLSGNSEKVFTSQECIILDKTPCALWKSWRPTAPPIEQKHKYHTVIICFHFFEVITLTVCFVAKI